MGQKGFFDVERRLEAISAKRGRARQSEAGRRARSLQHWQRGLGGQRLPLGGDRSGSDGEGVAQSYPPARRVEHVFGQQQNSMDGKIVRTIGIVRARFKIGMMNLGYNIRRLVQLERMAAAPA